MNKEILGLIEKLEPYGDNINTLSEIIEKTGKEIIKYRNTMVSIYCNVDTVLNLSLEKNLYEDLVRAAHYLDYKKIYLNISDAPLGEKGIELQKSFFSINSLIRLKEKSLDEILLKLKSMQNKKNFEYEAQDVLSYFLYNNAIKMNEYDLNRFFKAVNLNRDSMIKLFFLARLSDWYIVTNKEDRHIFPAGITERYLLEKINEKRLYISLN